MRYGSWSADRQGWLLGLSGAAWTSIGLGGLPLLVAVGARRWPLAAGWTPIWALVVIAVAVPVRGRSALRWTGDCLARAVGISAGWSDWQSRAAGGVATYSETADLPGVLSGIAVHDGPPYGPLMVRPAMVADHRARTWAVVARIAHPGIGLTEASGRARMGAGLAELLEGAATSGLASVLALQVRTLPDDGAERAAWARTHLRPDAPPLAAAVTAELTGLMAQAGIRHEAFLTVVVPEARIGRLSRDTGGGVEGRARILHALMGQLEARLLGSVGATSVDWLDTPALATAIRTGFAPGDRAGLVTAQLAATGAGLPLAAAGPTATPVPDRRHYSHDAWHTATCTVLLPDKGAVMGALAPVLTPAAPGERRSVTVFFEPVGRARADRLVGAQAMSADLAADLRRRGGFQTRAAHRRDAARVAGQDLRLADGNALVRVALAAAVTVPDGSPISEAARRLEGSITVAGFTPLRLDLAQDTGFAAACIPLGIGPPARRSTR